MNSTALHQPDNTPPEEKSGSVSSVHQAVHFPLSFGQHRLWFLDQFEPGNSAYNSSGGIRLGGQLNILALQQALNEIIIRHEVLRTTFNVLNGTPMQVVHGPAPFALQVVDYSGFPSDVCECKLQRLACSNAEQPFNLADGPLLRGALVRMGDHDHVLLLTIHHIISDGWSIGIFARELSVLYENLSAGKASPLPELSIQYGDYAEWQREYLKGAVLDRLRWYWCKQLAGAPVLELPTDRPRPAMQTFNGADVDIQFDRQLLEDLTQLSVREGGTLFMTLLAAFSVLLARYSGQEDVCVGTPIANRTHVETEPLMGFFVNTLVMRCDLSGNPSFRTLLQRVRKLALQAYAHQDLPFEKIVEELQLKRDLSRSPLFQVMFVLQNTPFPELCLPGLMLSPVEVAREVAKFDLTITMGESESGLAGRIEYNRELFDRATIERLAGHWERLLRSIVADPSKLLSELSLLTEAECRVFDDWNRTNAPYPRQKTITQLFEEQAAKSPSGVALRQDGDELSFGELNRRANRIARWLQQQGACPGSLVGVAMERSLDTVVALLAILKAGAAYVPLDPAYPRDRLQFMLSDSATGLVFTRQAHKDQLQREGTRVLCVDSDDKEIAAQSDQDLPASATSDSLAYVLYTSGSTGRPKGVMAPHLGTINRLAWMWKQAPFAAGEVCCQKTSLNFVDSVWELFGPLLRGIPSVIVSNRVVQDPRRLIQSLARHKVSRIVLVPSLLRVLLDSYQLMRDIKTPKLWIVSGEALTNELASKFRKVMPEGTLLNLYGSSEVAADATWYRVRGDESGTAGVPIGRPISNVQIRILDRFGNQVPVGIPGEIYVGGDALARGYLNQPHLTRDRFVPDPFTEGSGARLYKTGDIGHYRPDGVIEYLGRTDHQVKIRGHRVELGEIESVLREHQDVKDCVAVARGATAADRRIVAYIASEGDALHVEALHKLLRSRLPEFMQPSAITRMPSLPLTPNGKVDRLALPEPTEQHFEFAPSYVPPRDALELQITGVWENVLGAHPIGVYDNFFELGGHSFLAIDLFSELEKSFGKVLPVAALFQAPTIAQLADVVRHEGWESAWKSLVPLQPEGSAAPFFCIHSLGTNLVSYGRLARGVGKDQPFYGLQPIGLDGKHAPHTRVEDMATHYLSQVRNLQPHGPYYLGGVCLGGVVAFEMAQQLRREGESVGLLLLIDSQFPGSPLYFPKHPLRPTLTSLVDYYLGDLLMLPMQGRPRYIATRIRNVSVRLAKAGRKLLGRILPGVEGKAVVASTIQKVKSANSRAGGHYHPQSYDGKVTLFWCSEVPSRSYQDRRLGWSETAGGGLEVHVIPGNHLTMVDNPHVAVMAYKLRACLEKSRLATSNVGRAFSAAQSP